jgi:hypothetical protein
VDFLLADPTRARTELDWQPKVTFRDLCASWWMPTWSCRSSHARRGQAILEERFGGLHRWETSRQHGKLAGLANL